MDKLLVPSPYSVLNTTFWKYAIIYELGFKSHWFRDNKTRVFHRGDQGFSEAK